MDTNIVPPTIIPIPPSSNTQPPIGLKFPKKLLFLLIVFVFLIAVLVFFYLLNRTKSEILTETPQTPGQKLEGLGVLYGYSSYDKETASWNDPKRYISNLDNTQRVEVTDTAFADYTSPSSGRYMKVDRKSIQTSVNNDPNTLKTIVDISGRNDVLDLGSPRLSPDENKLVYEIRINRPLDQKGSKGREFYSEAQYWTINYDGSENKMVGSIRNDPGGHFLGYDFAKNIIYATMNRFEKVESTSVVTYDPVNSSLDEKIRLPIDTGMAFSSDFHTMYYEDGSTTIKALNMDTKEETTLLAAEDIEGPDLVKSMFFSFSGKEKILLVSIQLKNREGTNKYLYNVETRQLDKSLKEEKYQYLSFDPFNTFSPDGNYIILTSANMDRVCLWDRQRQAIIPFFKCELTNGKYTDEKIHEGVAIIRWIPDLEKIPLSNIKVPTKTPSPIPESLGKYGTSFNARTSNIARMADINTLLSAILAYKEDHDMLPTEIITEIQPISKQGADLCQELTKTKQYIGALPRDPAQQFDPSNQYAKGGSVTNCDEDYVTGFTVSKDSDGKVTVHAPLTQEVPILSVSGN